MTIKKFILLGFMCILLIATYSCSNNNEYTQNSDDTYTGIIDTTTNITSAEIVIDDSEIEINEPSQEPSIIDVWDGSISLGYAGGKGTEDDPYMIEKASQLAFMAYQVNNGDAYKNMYFILNNDLDLNNIEWIPIGRYKYENYKDINLPFAGYFDGNNKKIYNLQIIDENNKWAGLFGNLYEATIKNINIGSGEVVITDDYAYAGGICAIARFSKISACTNDAKVTGSAYTGGIVGDIYNNSQIDNCINYGTITSYGTSYNKNDVRVSGDTGGIAGSALSISISNCANYGYIYDYSEEKSSIGGTGGIVGGGGNCTSCTNYGVVYGISKVGGIAGSGSSNYCFNYDVVSGKTYVGGIIGRGGAYNSANLGEITGIENVGGICGGDNSIIKECFNYGDVAGQINTGGIVGDDSSVYNSFNVANVSGKEYTGGIIGNNFTSRIYGQTIESCYNIGNIVSDYITGGIAGISDERCKYINCYYSNTSANNDIAYGENSYKSISANISEMKTEMFCSLLNNGTDIWLWNELINEGLPILNWSYYFFDSPNNQ
jgi:hypothetical protein